MGDLRDGDDGCRVSAAVNDHDGEAGWRRGMVKMKGEEFATRCSPGAAACRPINQAGESGDRCLAQAADALAKDAERMFAGGGGAMLAAASMAQAIAQLHGVAGAKDIRKELRHRLVDIQAAIPDELTGHAFKLDTEPLVAAVGEAMDGKGLFDRLFIFLTCAQPPDLDQLTADAVEMVKASPLHSRVATGYLDGDGKTLHRIAGGGNTGTPRIQQ